jgi:tetratricopeptide (TPR) repeat protein
MRSLRHVDVMHLEAAQGWLELDNHLEAKAELDQIPPQFSRHPDVLELGWKIYAKAQRWDACLEIAEDLTDSSPRRTLNWLYLAASLSALKQPEEAYETLVDVVDDFPENVTIPYQLACYACEIGEIDEARKWLQDAFDGGDAKELRALALKDVALQPLWKHISNLQPKGPGDGVSS